MNGPIQNGISVGIDTSQACLDIYIRARGEDLSFDDNLAGIEDAIRFVRKFLPARV